MRCLWAVPACLAACLIAAPSAQATPLVLTDGTHLVSIDSAVPAAVSSVSVTGLQVGETLVGIDYRPADFQLYAVGSTSRLYVVNTVTGAATQVGTAGSFALNGTSFGMDFNPVVDRLRVVSDNEQNIRINPSTGALVATDTNLSPPGTVSAAAYTNNVAGATSTTLYDIDAATGHLVMQGGPGGVPSANGGALTDVGSLGLGTSLDPSIGLDVAPDGTAYASVVSGGVDRLYTVDLATGAATPVGTIGTGVTQYEGLAASTALLQPSGPGSVAEGETATVTVGRAGPTASAAGVSYSTQAGTAAAGTDFTPVSGTLSWASGDGSAKSFSIPILTDSESDGGETLDVSFGNASGAGVAPAKLTVSIADVAAGPPAAGGTSTPPRDTRAPVLGISAGTQKLRKAIRRGAALRVKTDEACAFHVDLTVPKRLAKRLKIRRRVGARSASLQPGARTLRVKVNRRLRRVRKLTLTARASCTDSAGNRAKTSAKFKLRR